jgi:hypothetical protein
LGKGKGEKFTTQRAAKVAAGGFPAVVGRHCAIELMRNDTPESGGIGASQLAENLARWQVQFQRDGTNTQAERGPV